MIMKDHFKQLSLAVPALLLAFTTLAAVPVFAKDGVSGDATVTSGTTTSISGERQKVAVTSTSGSNATGAETEVSTASTVASDDSQTAELHSKGKDMVAELQKEHKSTKTATERQKVCEVHKQGLTNKFTVITRNSQSYQTRIDDVYTKALAFQTTSKTITSADLTTLIATAKTAQATSAASIVSLKAVTPNADLCNNVSVAQDVATFKAATTQTRTDLKAYKTAVKAVVQNLLAATKTTTDATTSPTTTPEKSN